MLFRSVSFEVPPGKIQLRIAVEGPDADTLDSEVRELTIPDLTTPQTTIGTPQFFRARNVRETQQAKTDPNAVPTAQREFSRTDRLVVRVAAYGPGVNPPTMSARPPSRAAASGDLSCFGAGFSALPSSGCGRSVIPKLGLGRQTAFLPPDCSCSLRGDSLPRAFSIRIRSC